MSDVPSRPSLGAAVYYVDPFAALDWLEKAFGFERQFVVTDSDGQLGHSEMRFGDGYLMVCRAWNEDMASPQSLDGKNTQSVHVQLRDGIDEHCVRARSRRSDHARTGGSVLRGPRLCGA